MLPSCAGLVLPTRTLPAPFCPKQIPHASACPWLFFGKQAAKLWGWPRPGALLGAGVCWGDEAVVGTSWSWWLLLGRAWPRFAPFPRYPGVGSAFAFPARLGGHRQHLGAGSGPVPVLPELWQGGAVQGRAPPEAFGVAAAAGWARGGGGCSCRGTAPGPRPLCSRMSVCSGRMHAKIRHFFFLFCLRIPQKANIHER